MIPVAEALAHCFALAPAMPVETVPIRDCAGRVLARDMAATRDQPPFAASAMDGYAVAGDAARGAAFDVIGTSAAGQRFAGSVGAGQAVRIYTGAPLPDGASRVIIQEDVTSDGDRITVAADPGDSDHIRPAGTDFRAGATVSAPRRLTASDLALLASMNHATLPVARRPVVALIATGDELVMPGENPGPDQIIASNSVALAAIAGSDGAEARILPIAQDNEASLRLAFELAKGADLIVTSGGASVGDHDLVGPVAEKLGMKQSFYKVAMRPGKPLMAGRMGDAMLLGLPGNPVSAIVCAHVFLRTTLRAMQGLPARPLPRQFAKLAAPVAENGPREHYMRARLDDDGNVQVLERQDSSLLSVLAEANALAVRPPHDPARRAGDAVEVISI